MSAVNSEISRLNAIAVNAYGTGMFEGADGGAGYMGSYVDQDGKMHSVKVLTHSDERASFLKEKPVVDTLNAEEAGSSIQQRMIDATDRLESELLSLARAAGKESEVKAKLAEGKEKAQKEGMLIGNKPLLSRKIVATTVSLIAKGLNAKVANAADKFSWKAIGKAAAKSKGKETSLNAAFDRLNGSAFDLKGMKLNQIDLGKTISGLRAESFGSNSGQSVGDLIGKADSQATGMRDSFRLFLQEMPSMMQSPVTDAKAFREFLGAASNVVDDRSCMFVRPENGAKTLLKTAFPQTGDIRLRGGNCEQIRESLSTLVDSFADKFGQGAADELKTALGAFTDGIKVSLIHRQGENPTLCKASSVVGQQEAEDRSQFSSILDQVIAEDKEIDDYCNRLMIDQKILRDDGTLLGKKGRLTDKMKEFKAQNPQLSDQELQAKVKADFKNQYASVVRNAAASFNEIVLKYTDLWAEGGQPKEKTPENMSAYREMLREIGLAGHHVAIAGADPQNAVAYDSIGDSSLTFHKFAMETVQRAHPEFHDWLLANTGADYSFCESCLADGGPTDDLVGARKDLELDSSDLKAQLKTLQEQSPAPGKEVEHETKIANIKADLQKIEDMHGDLDREILYHSVVAGAGQSDFHPEVVRGAKAKFVMEECVRQGDKGHEYLAGLPAQTLRDTFSYLTPAQQTKLYGGLEPRYHNAISEVVRDVIGQLNGSIAKAQGRAQQKRLYNLSNQFSKWGMLSHQEALDKKAALARKRGGELDHGKLRVFSPHDEIMARLLVMQAEHGKADGVKDGISLSVKQDLARQVAGFIERYANAKDVQGDEDGEQFAEELADMLSQMTKENEVWLQKAQQSSGVYDTWVMAQALQ